MAERHTEELDVFQRLAVRRPLGVAAVVVVVLLAFGLLTVRGAPWAVPLVALPVGVLVYWSARRYGQRHGSPA
jgi:hypothetical protein